MREINKGGDEIVDRGGLFGGVGLKDDMEIKSESESQSRIAALTSDNESLAFVLRVA